MRKIVLDTNIWISALIYGGNPRHILERAQHNQIALIVSQPIIEEIVRVLKDKFAYPVEALESLRMEIVDLAELVDPQEMITQVTDEPADNRILEAAWTARADVVVTGDAKHLLSLKEYRGIPILSPAEFLKLM